MDNTQSILQQFSALRDREIVYLDNAATTQMPDVVLETMTRYELAGRGNPYRGLHAFAARATELLVQARATVAGFVGAQSDQLLFTKSTTEGLNLVAAALGAKLGPEDEVVLTIFEHHANVLPWRELARERGFKISYLPMSANGNVDIEQARRVITPNTKVVVAMHVSNVLGTVLPIDELADITHAAGALLIVDAAQSVARMTVNVDALKCDALAFGAHKMYGPEGIGALYVRENLRSLLRPLLYGGGMVDEVLDDDIRYAEDIRLFEAGSPNVAGAVGFAEACTFLTSIGLENIRRRELELTESLIAELHKLPGIKVYSPEHSPERVGVVSFAVNGVHSHDVAQMLADRQIAVRAGYHCAAPLTRCLNSSGTVRVSFGVHNDVADVDRLIVALKAVLERFV